MSNENQLLLQDLSARLPYEVKVLLPEIRQDIAILVGIDDKCFTVSYDKSIIHCPFGIEIKPYLRPLSSMTKKEKAELQEMVKSNPIRPYGKLTNKCDNLTRSVAYGAFDIISYLLSKHFDIKNLIEKGLALKAPEGMYASELTESEDEKVRKELLLDIPKVFSHDKAFRYIAWLEKQKLEWSDVDEVRLDEAIQMVEANGNWVRSEDSVKLVSDWLKSLKERYYPQNHWKPTEEHIKVLSIFADNMVEPYYKGVILDLLEQLKVL